jgi:hypothetical protein
MGVRDEVYWMVRQEKLDPWSIAKHRGVSSVTIFGYINQLVGEGRLTKSEVYFTFPEDVAQGISEEYARWALDDMYENLRAVEIHLHTLIRQVLVSKFGDGEFGWWRGGIPENLRTKLAARREGDREPAEHAYHYTDLIDLGEILAVNWEHFQKEFPSEISSNRKALLSDLVRLNGIRNRVMHPVRSSPPIQSEFEFVESIKQKLGVPRRHP